MIVHNGDNYTNKLSNIICLDDNNKENIKKIRWNKMLKTEGIGKKKECFKEKSKTKQNKATWTGMSMLVTWVKALGISNKGMNNRDSLCFMQESDCHHQLITILLWVRRSLICKAKWLYFHCKMDIKNVHGF